MRRIVVLGSTGSIGTQTLDVARRHSDKLKVVGLAVNARADDLLAQARAFACKGRVQRLVHSQQQRRGEEQGKKRQHKADKPENRVSAKKIRPRREQIRCVWPIRHMREQRRPPQPDERMRARQGAKVGAEFDKVLFLWAAFGVLKKHLLRP